MFLLWEGNQSAAGNRLAGDSLQPDAPEQICEARVRTQTVEHWLDFQSKKINRVFFVSLFEPGERLIAISQSGMQDSEMVWRNVHAL